MNEFVEKLKKVARGRTVVYIDSANLERSVRDMWVVEKDIPEPLKGFNVGDLCWSVDYARLKEFFSLIGSYQGTRFYTADFGSDNHRKFLYFLDKRLNFKLITKPLKEYSDHTADIPHRKANFDVEIGVDSASSIESYDTMILFSGDCDFEYLIKFIRGRGKIAIGFSRSGHIAKELPPALSHYFDIVDFRKEILKIAPRKAKSPGSCDPEPRS
jgi:uncharacterized LabA/DUF88 family protein